MLAERTIKAACIVDDERLYFKVRKIISDNGYLMDPCHCSNAEAAEKLVKEEEYLFVLTLPDYLDCLRQSAGPGVSILCFPPDAISLLDCTKKLYDRGSRQIAFITRSDFFDEQLRSFDFSQFNVKTARCPSESAVAIALGQARLDGTDGIISSPSVCAQAEALGLKAEIHTLSDAVLSVGLSMAQRVLHLEKVKRLQLNRLDLVINNIGEGILIFNRDHEPVFHNVQVDAIMHGVDPWSWYDEFRPFFEKTLNVSKVLTVNGKQVLMRSMHFVFPQTDIDNYVVVLHEGSEIEQQEHKIRRHNIGKGLIAKATFASMIVGDGRMKNLVENAKKFAGTNSTVLICGETGVGKELFAQSIHNASARKSQSFVSVNCASLPPSLIESELFGYAPGSFTGARQNGKKGLFELAQGGTIFLDEIGELPLDIQARLLRVLQEREIMRIGDDRVIPLDVRLICATNRHLWELSLEGKFRLDLYYRINVLRLRVPALRDRRDDIIPLFECFLRKFFNSAEFSIDDDAKDYLLSYPWPGNIRELRNVAEAVVLFGRQVSVASLKEIMWMGDSADSVMQKLPVMPPSAEQVSTVHSVTDTNAPARLIVPPAPSTPSAAASSVSEGGAAPGSLILEVPEGSSLKDLERLMLETSLKTMSPEEVCAKFKISRVTLWRKLRRPDVAEALEDAEEPV